MVKMVEIVKFSNAPLKFIVTNLSVDNSLIVISYMCN